MTSSERPLTRCALLHARLVGVCDVALTLLFGAGALSKLANPHHAADAVSQLVARPAAAFAIVACAAGLECFCCAAGLFAAVTPGWRVKVGTVVLHCHTAWLLALWHVAGADAICGCAPWIGRASARSALWGNAWMIALCAGTLGLGVVCRRGTTGNPCRAL